MCGRKSGSFWGLIIGAVIALVGMQSCALLDEGDGGNDDDVVVGDEGNPSDGPTGYIGFHIEWPGRGGNTAYAIDPDTEWLRIRLKNAQGADYFSNLVYPATNLEIEVPAGTYTVEVLAFKDEAGFVMNPMLLSYGLVSGIVVQQYQIARATVTLAASSVSFTVSTPVYYGSQPNVVVNFANYSREIREAAFWILYRIGAGSWSGLCQVPSSTDNRTSAGCTASSALPTSGSNIEFSAVLDGSSYSNGSNGLYPSGDGISTMTVSLSALPFEEAPSTGVDVGIQ